MPDEPTFLDTLDSLKKYAKDVRMYDFMAMLKGVNVGKKQGHISLAVPNEVAHQVMQTNLEDAPHKTTFFFVVVDWTDETVENARKRIAEEKRGRLPTSENEP